MEDDEHKHKKAKVEDASGDANTGTTKTTTTGDEDITNTNTNTHAAATMNAKGFARQESIGLGRLPSFDLDNLEVLGRPGSTATGSFTLGEINSGSVDASMVSMDMGMNVEAPRMGSVTQISGISVPEDGNLLKSLPSLPSQTNVMPGPSSLVSPGSHHHHHENKHVHFEIADLAPTPPEQDLFHQDAGGGGKGSQHEEGGGILRAPSIDLGVLQKLESQPSFEKLKSQPSLLRLGSFGLNQLTKLPSLSRMPSLARVGSLTRMGSIGNALQSAKSGEFLDFLNEITAQQLLEEGATDLDDDLDSVPPTPTTPMDTPRQSPTIHRDSYQDASPEAGGGGVSPGPEDTSARGTVNNPENDLFMVNEGVFREAVETTKASSVLLKTYLLSDERAGDILFFPQDRLPWFEKEKIRRDGRQEKDGAKKGKQQKGTPSPSKRPRTVTRVSDKQEQCICSLRPSLMFPEGTKGWRFEQMRGPACKTVRNTTAAKKELENYKYTGFCKDHVEGKGLGSRQTWEENGKCSVRGFNLERNVNDRRMRHLLCLETGKGYVFLKWCTQCHLWKNFAGFTDRDEKGGKDLVVHTFCRVCHQRQVLSRDKRRMERAKKRKAVDMTGGKKAGKDKDLEEVAEKINLMRQNTMDRAWIKSFALESTLSKYNKFSKTIFENMGDKPIICGVFSGSAEDIIMMRATDVILDLQINPHKSPQLVGGEGRWIQVVTEIMENDLEPVLAQYGDMGGSREQGSGGAGGGLQRQTSLELWGKSNKTEIVKRRIQELMQDDDVRYKIVLLGSLLVESRLQSLLEREVRLEAMYEGCILMAFTCDLKPGEKEANYMQLSPDQMFGLRKMGWSGLQYKCSGKVLPLVDGPKPHQDALVEIVEMVGVKAPPRQLIEKTYDGLDSLYPSSIIQAACRDVSGLVETLGKPNSAGAGEGPAEAIDWQGCSALHHAVVRASQGQEDQVLGTLLYHKADCMKQNRRGFTPLEVAALTNPQALPVLVGHYFGSKAAGSKEDKSKVLRKLQKTLESSVQHVKHDLVKHNASLSITVIRDLLLGQQQQ
mmetsp:Transcript_4297/g.12600  ORF Transcript_4297/g.12600 Transcript_4297/m.12600 type:complete len:1054 (-) Transcript_4297:107-3268(-)